MSPEERARLVELISELTDAAFEDGIDTREGMSAAVALAQVAIEQFVESLAKGRKS